MYCNSLNTSFAVCSICARLDYAHFLRACDMWPSTFAKMCSMHEPTVWETVGLFDLPFNLMDELKATLYLIRLSKFYLFLYLVENP